jgi:glycosyltransferase involved in cell wall biosynthesis
VAWIRWPTPELVDALPRLAPAATVYECVDAYHHTPGIRGRWAAVHEAAERDLVRRADLVVVPGEVLAARFREWGADVRVLPHGVDPMDAPPARTTAHPPVVGFVGTLDYRLDLPLLRMVATARPEWRIRLIGPVQEGFDPSALAGLPNVTVEPAVPHARLGQVLTGFDVGMMPYADSPVYRAMTPVKTLELMAAGCPAVARPSPALAPYADLMYLAGAAEDFLAALERALAEDSPERAARRRAVAAENSWDHRMDEVATMLGDVLATRTA